MTHAFCTECGSFLFQRPKGATFRALDPASFHLETEEPNNLCGKSCKLPDSLLPTAHYNYENRLYDFNDDLPKWMTFAISQGNPGIRLTNDGKRIVS